MRDLKRAVREATVLGAEFRIVGDAVEIEGLDEIPDSTRAVIERFRDSGYLRSWLGGDDSDAVDFLDGLGVQAVLVTDDARAAVKELSSKSHVGIDIETWAPGRRPLPVAINADGSVSAVQKKDKDTSGLDPHRSEIATLQLYAGSNKCFVFRGEALAQLLGSKWLREQHLVAHNALFEVSFLRRHAKPAAGPPAQSFPVECTMQAAGLLNGVRRRSLAHSSADILGLDPPKALQLSCWGAKRLSAGQLAYAASDAVLAWRLWPEMSLALRQKRRWKAYKLQRDAIPAVADMELRGLGIDLEEHARQADAWAVELANARREYLEMTGNPAPNKPAEVRAWIVSVADDLAHWPRSPGGELSTERKYLKRLGAVPSARPVLSMLMMAKLLSSFGAKWAEKVNPVTGRIHCDFNIGESKAGRFAAKTPNLQQLPSVRAPEFRRCIVAAPGHVLVGGDWSQVEMRAAAFLSRDRALTAVYEQGRDLHAETASLMVGVPVERITKEQRAAAKPVNFGAIYGIGPKTLAVDAFDNYGIEMSESQAKDALDRFFSEYHQLHKWMWSGYHAAERHGEVWIDRCRVVEAKWEKSGKISYPQACNLPVQGIAAHAMLRALKLAFDRLKGLRGGLVACVHDELLAEVDEDDADRARVLLTEAMTEAFETTFPGAPTLGLVDVGVGKSWKDVKG